MSKFIGAIFYKNKGFILNMFQTNFLHPWFDKKYMFGETKTFSENVFFYFGPPLPLSTHTHIYIQSTEKLLSSALTTNRTLASKLKIDILYGLR